MTDDRRARAKALAEQAARAKEQARERLASGAEVREARKGALKQQLAQKKEVLAKRQEEVAERTGKARAARRRRRVTIAVLLAILILLLLLQPCRCTPEPEPDGIPVLIEPEPVEEVEAEPVPPPRNPPRIPKKDRPAMDLTPPAAPSWLDRFRLQVSARSPRLAACFEGSDEPGQLKWTTSVEPGQGAVSEHQLQPMLDTRELSAEERTCVIGVLSSPRYQLGGDGPETPVRVGLVIAF